MEKTVPRNIIMKIVKPVIRENLKNKKNFKCYIKTKITLLSRNSASKKIPCFKVLKGKKVVQPRILYLAKKIVKKKAFSDIQKLKDLITSTLTLPKKNLTFQKC